MRVLLLIIIGLFMIYQVKAQETSPFEDSLLNLIISEHDTLKMSHYSELCWHFIYSDTPKAINYGKKAAQFAEKTDSERGRASAYNRIGVGYDVLGIEDSALHFYDFALKAGERLGSEISIAGTRNNIGLIYWRQGRYTAALDEYFQSLRIFESNKDSSGMGSNLNNIGLIKFDMDEYEQALAYHRKSLRIRREINHEYGIAASLSNIAAIYWQLNEPDSAFYYAFKGIEIKKRINDRYGLMTAYSGIGSEYGDIDDIKNSLAYYDSSLSISKDLNVEPQMASTYHNIASEFRRAGNYRTALSYLDSSVTLSNKHDILRLRMLNHYLRALIFEETGRHREALAEEKLHKSLKDSLFNEEKSKQLSEIEILYESEKKESLNNALLQENQIAQLENDQSRAFLFGSLGVMMVLMIGGTFYYSIERTKRENRKQKKIIQEREKSMLAVVEATEDERKRIAKDLHDGVGQQLSGLKMAWEKLIGGLPSSTQKESQKLETLSTVLDEACTDLRSISHQMMPKSLSTMGLAPAIRDMLEKSLDPSGIEFQFDAYNVDDRFLESTELGLYRICQELINNIIKHSRAQQVNVQLFRNKDLLLLIVEDNGVGIDLPTQKDGIGLTNISARLSTLGGEFKIEPGPEKGTIATIRITIS